MIVSRQWDDSTYDLTPAEKDLLLALESSEQIDTPLLLTLQPLIRVPQQWRFASLQGHSEQKCWGWI